MSLGDLVRISPTDLLTADPEFVRRMNAARSPYKRGKWYDYARPDGQLCSVFTETDMKKHDALRAQLAPGVCRFSAMYGAQVAYISDCIHSLQYSGREVPDLESHIDARILDFVALIERKYLSEASTGQLRPLDLGMAVPYFTLDVITDIAYGAPFGYLEKDEDLHNYIAEILIGLRIGIGIGMFPWLAKLLRTRLAMALIGSSPPGITAVLEFVDLITFQSWKF